MGLGSDGDNVGFPLWPEQTTSDGGAHTTQCGAVGAVGQTPEAGSSGCAPPHRLWEAPSLAHGGLAGSAPHGTVPFHVPAKATPASRGPENFGPRSLPPASTGYLAHLADPGRLPGYLYDQSHHCDLSSFCDLLPHDTHSAGLGPLQ